MRSRPELLVFFCRRFSFASTYTRCGCTVLRLLLFSCLPSILLRVDVHALAAALPPCHDLGLRGLLVRAAQLPLYRLPSYRAGLPFSSCLVRHRPVLRSTTRDRSWRDARSRLRLSPVSAPHLRLACVQAREVPQTSFTSSATPAGSQLPELPFSLFGCQPPESLGAGSPFGTGVWGRSPAALGPPPWPPWAGQGETVLHVQHSTRNRLFSSPPKTALYGVLRGVLCDLRSRGNIANMARRALSRPPLILGCDPATAFGWGVLRGSKRVDSGAWGFADHKLGGRCEGVRSALLGLLSELPEYPVAIAYEEVHFMALKNKNNARNYWSLVGVIEAVAYTFDVPTYPIKVSEAKRVAGYGKATKTQMVDSAAERWGYEPADDNDADAMWMAEACRILFLGG